MVKHFARLAAALALVALGWSLGRAQTTAPDFELIVSGAPATDVAVKCQRGCQLAYRESNGGFDQTKSRAAVGFACGNSGPCDVPFAGWVQR
jgi:hypothetical protein